MIDQLAPVPDAIHKHFGLTYANYLVVHRSFLQSMPDEFQTRFVAMLEELDAAFDHIEKPDSFKVEAAVEREISDLDEDEQRQHGITVDWYRGETPPDGLDDADLAEWRAEHEDPDGPVYYRDGQEVDGDEVVLIPVPDPVPHYNRGRTYIAPKLPERGEGSLCPFGEGDAPGSGCILPAGHQPANRHVVTPGDTDLD